MEYHQAVLVLWLWLRLSPDVNVICTVLKSQLCRENLLNYVRQTFLGNKTYSFLIYDMMIKWPL